MSSFKNNKYNIARARANICQSKLVGQGVSQNCRYRARLSRVELKIKPTSDNSCCDVASSSHIHITRLELTVYFKS